MFVTRSHGLSPLNFAHTEAVMNTWNTNPYQYSSGVTPVGFISLFFALIGIAWLIAG